MVYKLFEKNEIQKKQLLTAFNCNSIDQLEKKIKTIEKDVLKEKGIKRIINTKNLQLKFPDDAIDGVAKGITQNIVFAIKKIDEIQERYSAYEAAQEYIQFVCGDKICNESEKDEINEDIINSYNMQLNELSQKQLETISEIDNVDLSDIFSGTSKKLKEIEKRVTEWGDFVKKKTTIIPPTVKFDIPFERIELFKKYNLNEIIKLDRLRQKQKVDSNFIEQIGMETGKGKVVKIIAKELVNIHPLFPEILSKNEAPFEDMKRKLELYYKQKLFNENEFKKKLRILSDLEAKWNKK